MRRHVFISYSHDDREFTTRLAEALLARGQDVWLDRWELSAGDSIIDKIFEEGLKDAVAVLIVLSKSSIGSKWVREELNAATVRRLEGQTRVIPILLDDIEIPVALRTLLWVDMRDNFEGGVRQVLNALHGVRERPPLGVTPDYLRLSDSVGDLSRLATEVGAAVLRANDPDSEREHAFENTELAEQLGLSPEELNDAVAELESEGLVTVLRTFGTAPYDFLIVEPTYRLFHYFKALLRYDPIADVRTVLSTVVAAGSTDGPGLQRRTGLPYSRLNRAVDYLADEHLAEVYRVMGTRPFTFGQVDATQRTRQAVATNAVGP